MTWEAVFPVNNGRPLNISKRTTPKDHTSARWSATSPLACSGDM